MNPRTAIAAAALRVDRGHLECQTLILKCVCCGRLLAPGVVSGAGDLEYPAHQPHRIAGLLRCDKSESHSLSLAKKAVAFFRISRSSRSRWFSRLSSASSSRSLRFKAPSGPRPASISACATHRRRAVWPMPSSTATWPMLLPLRWISRTVSALYSAEKPLRFRLPSFSTVHSLRAYFRAFRSVHQIGASPNSAYTQDHPSNSPSANPSLEQAVINYALLQHSSSKSPEQRLGPLLELIRHSD